MSKAKSNHLSLFLSIFQIVSHLDNQAYVFHKPFHMYMWQNLVAGTCLASCWSWFENPYLFYLCIHCSVRMVYVFETSVVPLFVEAVYFYAWIPSKAIFCCHCILSCFRYRANEPSRFLRKRGCK